MCKLKEKSSICTYCEHFKINTYFCLIIINNYYYYIIIILVLFVQMLENLETSLSSSDHFKFHWFPHTGCVKYFDVNRTSKVSTWILLKFHGNLPV